ncbi:MAG: sulfotransferase family 2 domain-containing protein [Candidatus Aureabacteria bacterium]|nr:sulfotransferase family 2 domain-containing protein [Candidatus Auribacterota bacterium]
MPIFHKYKCIFIHIPKSAGTSINAALGIGREGIQSLFGKISEEEKAKYGLTHTYWHHCPISLIKPFIPEGTFNKYFKFTFLRNPWDRLVSLYLYYKRINRLDNIDAFNQWILSKKIPSYLLIPQLDYITDNKGNIIVDFIGRFENMDKDWKYITKKTGANTKLLPVNISNRKHYSFYYTEETIRVVGELFRKDIETFGYRFEKAGFFKNRVYDVKHLALFSGERTILKIKTLLKETFPKLYLKLKKFKQKL